MLSAELVNFYLENIKYIHFREIIINGKLHSQMYFLNKKDTFNKTIDLNVREMLKKYKYQEYQDSLNIQTKGYQEYTLIEKADIPKFTILYAYLKHILGREPKQEELAKVYIQLFCYLDDNGYYHIKEEFLTRDERGYVRYQRQKDEKEPTFIKFTLEQERFTYLQLQRRLSKPYPSFLREDAVLLDLTLNNTNKYLIFYKDTYFDLMADGDILCDNLKTKTTIVISIYNRSDAGLSNRAGKEYNNSHRKITIAKKKIRVETVRSRYHGNINIVNTNGVDLMQSYIIKNILKVINSNEEGVITIK